MLCQHVPLDEYIKKLVLEVPIDQNVTGIQSGTVKNWVTAEAQAILNGTGIDLYGFTQNSDVLGFTQLHSE